MCWDDSMIYLEELTFQNSDALHLFINNLTIFNFYSMSMSLISTERERERERGGGV